MTESYNTTCMQRHLIDIGTTVPASFRVFTPSSLFRTQSEFISPSARFESTFNGSSLMERRQMTDARFLIRAQAPAALQSMFGSASAFCVGGDLSTSLSALSILSPAIASPNAGTPSITCWSDDARRYLAAPCTLRAAAEFTATSAESLPFVSSRSTTLPLWRPCFPATCISEHPDYTHLSSSVPLIRVPGHDGMQPCAKAKYGTSFAEGFAFFSVPGLLCDAGWRFLSSSVAITVTADWMRTRSYFSFSRTASAKFERFRAVAAFRSVHPSMERALRL